MIESSENDFIVAVLLACAVFAAYRYKIKKDSSKSDDNINSEIQANVISGPKGWITLFQMLLSLNAITGGIFFLGSLYNLRMRFEFSSERPDWQIFMNFNYAYALINFIFSIYIAYRLEKVLVKATVNFVFFFIYGMILLDCIGLLLLITSDFFKIYLSGKIHSVDIVIKLIFSFIFIKLPWLLYFKKSKRVRNTYIYKIFNLLNILSAVNFFGEDFLVRRIQSDYSHCVQ